MQIILVVISLLISAIESSHWTYEDIEHWPERCQNGKSQSPINFEDKKIVETTFDKFEFEFYHTEVEAAVRNVGHSVALNLENTTIRPSIRGGGLTKEYTFNHLHFHWQSEHTLDGYRFPLEVHLVHYATDYSNLHNALNYKDGIAVLGIFYDLSPDDDEEFQPFIKALEIIEEHPHTYRPLNPVELHSFLPRDVAGFYRYHGSLTTPHCNESVIWTIFTNTVPISKSQVQHFQSVHSDTGVLNFTYRSTQPLNGRTVFKKVSPIPHGSGKSKINLSMLLMTVYLLLVMCQ